MLNGKVPACFVVIGISTILHRVAELWRSGFFSPGAVGKQGINKELFIINIKGAWGGSAAHGSSAPEKGLHPRPESGC
jgi:hypothetical protein